jgi:hypothetical protein
MRKVKGRKFYVVLGLVLIAAFGIVLYLNLRPDNGYRSAIPRDAKAVMVIDFAQTAQNLGFTVKDLMLHYDKMSSAGLDFSKPLYGFVAQNGNMGLVASVVNADQLDENLHNLGFETETRRGLVWCIVGNFLVSHDDEKMLAMGPTTLNASQDLYEQMAELMIQGSSESDILVSLDEQPGEIKLYTHADVLPQSVTDHIAMHLPEGADLSKVEVKAAVGVTNRKVTFEASLDFADDRLRDYFVEFNKSFHPVNGRLLNLAPADPVFWACANIEGDHHLELMRHYKRLRPVLTALNTQLDADQIINAIEGDVSVSIPMLSLNKLHALVLAELKDTEFSEDATLEWKGAEWQSGICRNADRRGARLYYVSNDAGLAAKAGSLGSSEAYRQLKDEIVGCVFFASVNLSKMLYAVTPYVMMFASSPKLYETLDALDRLNVKMKDCTHFNIELNLKKDIRRLVL